jgi:PhoPQ-activated pathogenicity-related protein
VIAIIPIVIDTLNIQRQMQYQVETWGDWSPSIHDYTDRNLFNLESGNSDVFLQRLWKMIDPYFYRSRITIPKLLVHATNDPYWTVDASQNYWNELLGPKYLLTLSNVGHDLGSKQLNSLTTIIPFAKNVFQGGAWHNMQWKFSESGAKYVVTVSSELPVKSAKIWTAKSNTKMFRAAKWDSVPLPLSENDSTNPIVAEIEKPSEGHIAFYVEIVSEFEEKPFSVTTQVWRK